MSTSGLVLLTEVYSGCNSGYSDCDFAILDLSQKKLGEIFSLRDSFAELNKQHEELRSITLWDCSPDWVLREGDTDASPEEDIQKVHNILAQEKDDCYVAISQEEYKNLTPSPLVNMRTECNELVIAKDSFYWTCTQKHTELNYVTSTIPFSWLEEVLCGVEK